MAYIAKLSNSGGVKSLNRYVSALAGNTAYVPSSYESIATLNPTSGTIATFSDIPQTYTHLQVRASFVLSASDNLLIAFNGDTNYSNYNGHQFFGSGTDAGAGVSVYVSYSPGSTNPGTVVTDILDSNSAAKNKVVRSLGGADNNGSGFLLYRSVLWMNTSPITSVSILTATGGVTFSAGTRIALYGIKGA